MASSGNRRHSKPWKSKKSESQIWRDGKIVEGTQGSRSRNEPNIVFMGHKWSDIIPKTLFLGGIRMVIYGDYPTTEPGKKNLLLSTIPVVYLFSRDPYLMVYDNHQITG